MSVVIRRVSGALVRNYRKRGGIRIADALAQAEVNLHDLGPEGLNRIDDALGRIAGLIAGPDRTLTSEKLGVAHGLVNEMLVYCTVADIPGFADALYACGRLIAALMSIEQRPDDALSPGVNLLRLARRGLIGPEDLRALIDGVEMCTKRFQDQGRASANH